jgi:hypothetical protein
MDVDAQVVPEAVQHDNEGAETAADAAAECRQPSPSPMPAAKKKRLDRLRARKQRVYKDLQRSIAEHCNHLLHGLLAYMTDDNDEIGGAWMDINKKWGSFEQIPLRDKSPTHQVVRRVRRALQGNLHSKLIKMLEIIEENELTIGVLNNRLENLMNEEEKIM